MRSPDKRTIHASVYFLVEARLVIRSDVGSIRHYFLSLDTALFSQTLSTFSRSSPSGDTVQ